MPVRIIIADDHPLLADGLKRVLEEMEGVQVAETVSNGRQLIASLRKLPVDLVLLDLHMPQLDGIEALKVLRAEFPRLKVLVFTSYNEPKLIRQVKELGAMGLLLKSSPSAEVKEAVRAVIQGQEWYRAAAALPAVSAGFTDEFMKKYKITRREVEIIRKIAEGHTSREIGEQLFVSEFTVNAHRRNICRKLDINSAIGLVNFAKEHGIV